MKWLAMIVPPRELESLSSRRAWIEMIVGKLATIDLIVALLAEGVD